METAAIRPYALNAGEGWTYNYGKDFTADGIDITVKAGELRHGRRVACIEYSTRSGEEPPAHTHGTEDEMFFVLKGALTFRCGGHTFDVEDGGFVFLPRGLEHGYTIRSDAEVRLLVVTSPAQDGTPQAWGGFVADVEQAGDEGTPGDLSRQ